MPETFQQIIATHFAPFAPVQIGEQAYQLTLKGKEQPTIGTHAGADIPVYLSDGWASFAVLPFRYPAYSLDQINIRGTETFFHRDNLWAPGSFAIQPARKTQGGPVVSYNIMRKPIAPQRPSPSGLFAPRDATFQQWNELLEGDAEGFVPGATHRGTVDWSTDIGAFLALREADRYLNSIKVRLESVGTYWMAEEVAVQVLQAHGLIGQIAPHYPTYAEYLKSPRWAEIRAEVMTRDGHKCVFCKAPAEQVHHVVYPKVIGTENPASLLTVCRRCHNILHGALEAGGQGDRDRLP